MLALGILASTCLAISYTYHSAQAQVVDYTQTTLASVIFVRTGDHTPLFLGDDPIGLTSSGAQQLYNTGSFFRSRYLTNTDNATVSSQTAAAISGLSIDIVDNDQLYFLADEDNVMLVAAQAFAQGLYPPAPLSPNDTSALSDSSAILANGSLINSPLSNYQYVAIGSINADDPTSIITSGIDNCPAWDNAADSYGSSADFASLNASSQGLYDVVGSEFLNGLLNISDWNYANAYEIYDYVLYLANHNSSAAALINSTDYNGQNILVQLRSLASELLWSTNSYDASMTAGQNGSYPNPILSIAGATVAMSVLNIFQDTVASQGVGEQKLSVFVDDFQPFLGFASVSQLASRDPTFQGLPGYGSAMVWELFTTSNGSQGNPTTFPSTDDLWVRFLFLNGSDDLSSDGGDLIEYPLFNRDPDQTEMQWSDFESLMAGVATRSVFDWCNRCNAQTLFCMGINWLESNSGGNGSKMSNAVAGVIGAFVGIAVIVLLALLAVLVGGLRLHTVETSFVGPLGKWRQGREGQSTSHADPSAPGSGVALSHDNKHESLQSAVTAVNDTPRESDRVGIVGRAKDESWEMTSIRRSSLDDDDNKIDDSGKPVEARETV
ncbi:MAG: hypothetical protein M1821_000280 [Bathelium mastoideum]|nr:MAG: hypothetical protein M1821_000280 [Bathelium mastoideum]